MKIFSQPGHSEHSADDGALIIFKTFLYFIRTNEAVWMCEEMSSRLYNKPSFLLVPYCLDCKMLFFPALRQVLHIVTINLSISVITVGKLLQQLLQFVTGFIDYSVVQFWSRAITQKAPLLDVVQTLQHSNVCDVHLKDCLLASIHPSIVFVYLHCYTVYILFFWANGYSFRANLPPCLKA